MSEISYQSCVSHATPETGKLIAKLSQVIAEFKNPDVTVALTLVLAEVVASFTRNLDSQNPYETTEKVLREAAEAGLEQVKKTDAVLAAAMTDCFCVTIQNVFEEKNRA